MGIIPVGSSLFSMGYKGCLSRNGIIPLMEERKRVPDIKKAPNGID